MGFKPIKHNSKGIRLHKAIVSPDFDDKTVLVRNHWDYVEMWLQKEGQKESLMYWRQAENFYKASLAVPEIASPLTIYYCFLNATKALLTVKGKTFAEMHGATGKIQQGDTNLKNEIITFHRNGILASLCSYFGETCNGEQYSLKNLLYNLPFIHRSFNLTFPTGYPEIFIPLVDPHFVIKDASNQAWLCAELPNNYGSQHILNKITPLGFEKDNGVTNKCIIRVKKRFHWYRSGANKISNLSRLTNNHRLLRKKIHYIFGANTLWYLKRYGQPNCIDRHPLTIMFASMHRLSELARYQPTILHRHFELKQNWLLSEFIKGSVMEFIDQISCEITNQNLMQPAVRYPN
jgi:hypothetical protein